MYLYNSTPSIFAQYTNCNNFCFIFLAISTIERRESVQIMQKWVVLFQQMYYNHFIK